jgi:hypothetical protein
MRLIKRFCETQQKADIEREKASLDVPSVGTHCLREREFLSREPMTQHLEVSLRTIEDGILAYFVEVRYRIKAEFTECL